jgi:hypothetical protein
MINKNPQPSTQPGVAEPDVKPKTTPTTTPSPQKEDDPWKIKEPSVSPTPKA